MKRYCTTIILTVFVLLPLHAIAESGSTIIPHWQVYQNSTGSNDNPTGIWISNITSHDLSVSIIFYDKDGSIFTSSDATFYYENFQDNDTTIGAGTTAHLKVSGIIGEPNNFGYGIIQWENINSEHDAVGLVAWGMKFREGEMYNKGYSISINDGKPF